MAIQIRIIKEPVSGAPIVGSTFRITSIVRQSISLVRSLSRRERERLAQRERELAAMRNIEAQFIRVM